MDTSRITLTANVWQEISTSDAFVHHSNGQGKVVYVQSVSQPTPYTGIQPVYNVTVNQAHFNYTASPEKISLWAYAIDVAAEVSVTPLMHSGVPKGVFDGTRAITIQGYPEANVKNGLQYYTLVNWPLTDVISAGNSVNVVFTTTTKKLLAKTRIVHYAAEEIQLQIIENPTIDVAGTPIAASNYNAVNPVDSTVTIQKGATISGGTAIDPEPEYYFGANATAQRSGNSIPEGRERVIPAGSTYAIVMTNTGSGNARLQYYLDWFEGEPDLPLP